MAKVYWNNDERFGMPYPFTIEEMVACYRLNGWDEYNDEDIHGIERTYQMTDDEIEDDILDHDIVELGDDSYRYAADAYMFVRINLSQPSSAVQYRLGDSTEWEDSPFQSADFNHHRDPEMAALKRIDEWMEG